MGSSLTLRQRQLIEQARLVGRPVLVHEPAEGEVLELRASGWDPRVPLPSRTEARALADKGLFVISGTGSIWSFQASRRAG